MEIKQLKKRWFVLGTMGTLFFGSGLCLVIEAGHWKHEAVFWGQWVGFGTLGLILVMSGIFFLINSGILLERIRILSSKK